MNPLKYNPLKSSFSSEHIHESEVKSFINEWLRNVNEENLSAIVNMYSRNAILLPTLSSEICVGREEIQRYFVQFLGKEELQGRFTKLYVSVARFIKSLSLAKLSRLNWFEIVGK